MPIPPSVSVRPAPPALIVQTPLASTETDCASVVAEPSAAAVKPAGSPVAVGAGGAARAARPAHPASARAPAIMAREMYLPRCIVSLSLLFVASGRECGACGGPGLGAGALPH